MAVNIVNALLTQELDLNAFKVTKAASWNMQIKGAYSFLYPYIAQDFRGLRDCTQCHMQMAMQYASDPPGKGGRHSGYLPPLIVQTIQQINYGMQPIAKRGGDNVGTYEI